MTTTNLHPAPMPSTTEHLCRASEYIVQAIRQLETVPHEDPAIWEAKCSLLNAVANLRLARGE